MARQILPIAGQIIGGMIGGPVGAAIGGAIGGAVGQYVDPIRHQGPKLGEARAQTAQEGVYRPLVFGTGCVAGNVIHRSPRKVVRHRESVGKGNRDTVDSDRGYRTFAIRIAEAHTPEGYTLLRIWENETLVYDVRPESEIVAESEEYAERFRFYSGTQDQLPDPDLEAYLGVGNVNSYRGSCYIVFGNFDLTDYGDMVPQYRLEIASNASSENVEWYIVATQSESPFAHAFQASESGWSWDEPVSSPGFGGHLISSRGRVLVYTSNTMSYTDDRGANFVPVDDPPSSSSLGFKGFYDGSQFVIPCGNQGFATSPDGISWSQQATSVGAGTFVIVPGPFWVMAGLPGNLKNARISFSRGASWGEPHLALIQSDGEPASVYCGDSDGAITVIGGDDHAMAWSNGLGWTQIASPFSQGAGSVQNRYISRIKFGADSGGPIWIAVSGINQGGTAGQTAWSRNPVIGWNILSTGFGENVIDMEYHGGRFVAVGDGGRIKDLTDVTVGWIDRSGTLGSDWRIRSITRQHPSGQAEYDRVALSSVVGFCHRRTGQAASSYDVSTLTDELDGVVFADGYTARDAITALLPIYNADASEHDRGSGYRINYIKRGSPVVRTLSIGDLVDEPEETIREDPMERPRVLHMAFESPVTGYTAGKASIQRLSPDVKLVNEVSTYVPVTFKDVDEAWQRADVQMRVAWTEVHGERKFSIADDQLDVVPTDVLALSLRGQVQRLRVLKVEYADGVLKLETIADRQSNYTSHVTGIPLPAPEKPPPSLMGPAALAILDIPAISDQHDQLGYYVAVSGTTEAYAGAVIQRQQNGEWANVVSLGRSQRAIMGVLENTVAAGSEHYTDTTNTVSVALYMDDELESLSGAQWLNKGGAFALETATGWEIMQYRDAYQDSGGVWHLTHLARGRLNTVADEHQPGARFVLLDGVRFIEADVGMIGEDLTLRAAAVGRSPETAAPETITYQGNSQREFPVADLTANLNGSTLELDAIPRDRFGTEQHPVRSANHDGFRWAATDGSETVTADTDHATASLDVSGLSMPIAVTVAQLNRFTGAGPTVSEQVE